MFAKLARRSKSRVSLIALMAWALMMPITAESASAGGKTNNGAPSTTATYVGPGGEVRDHRGQQSGPPPPKLLPPHQRCRVNPYSGILENCSGVTIRDHRGAQAGGGGSSVCGHGTNVNCPPLHEK